MYNYNIISFWNAFDDAKSELRCLFCRTLGHFIQLLPLSDFFSPVELFDSLFSL